jgi:hypothetical protein
MEGKKFWPKKSDVVTEQQDHAEWKDKKNHKLTGTGDYM